MIIGFLLAITISASIASLGIIVTGSTGLLKENFATGAVIGPASAVSYALITLFISLIATFSLILLLKKQIRKYK